MATRSASGECWREFDRLNLPVAVLVNSEIYQYCPQVMEAFLKAGR